jgi:two-component system response regulator NreC
MQEGESKNPEESSSAPRKLRILLADDHAIVREGVKAVVERMASAEICGEAADGRTAVAMTEQLQPDIVILDVGMPELNGLEAARQIKRRSPNIEILMFTGDEDEKLIHDVFAAGARSYILKSDLGEHLIAAIEALGRHKHYFTNKTSEVIFSRYLNGSSGSGQGKRSGLTPRERELIQLLAEGKSNKTIASLLGISVKTVETHRASLMRKLQMSSFADLVRYAIRHKIVAP